ncbi:MAG: DoxX family protein [Candidatus Acidiferrales bacterium]
MPKGENSIVPLIGRVLISIIFIVSGLTKIGMFSMMTGYVAAKGLPLPPVSLGIAAAIEVFGGLAVLLGFRSRIAAWVLFAYLIPTTVVFHNFWAWTGEAAMDAQVHFFKNVAIMGGLLFLTAFGAGAYSIDNKRAHAV